MRSAPARSGSCSSSSTPRRPSAGGSSTRSSRRTRCVPTAVAWGQKDRRLLADRAPLPQALVQRRHGSHRRASRTSSSTGWASTRRPTKRARASRPTTRSGRRTTRASAEVPNRRPRGADRPKAHRAGGQRHRVGHQRRRADGQRHRATTTVAVAWLATYSDTLPSRARPRNPMPRGPTTIVS